MSKKTKSQPRFVVYSTEEEIKKAQTRATREGHRTHHKWAGVVIRKELSK